MGSAVPVVRAIQPALTGQGHRVGAATRCRLPAMVLLAAARRATRRAVADSRAAVAPIVVGAGAAADRTGRAMALRPRCSNESTKQQAP